MMSPLEKKPMFILVVSLLTSATTLYLLDAAGLPSPGALRPAQWVIYLFCFFGIWRSYSFLGWLAALYVAPSLVTRPQPTDRPSV
ncbi:hypothetical protein ACFQ09_11700 [Massilia norwichensis]|uniref:Uncharacterized protein n=1 Tax=Massilia norwichensis TaxID=1442366 RepID=A0ABT2A452_9BURK|nr:hypothetical protein [Massilia norwichensis]MCS0588954.1 hypothetical protein [Massilia norwichensis]